MLYIYLTSADGDTVEFVASQCILGGVAYPITTALLVGTYTQRWEYALCTCLMTPLACLTASGIYAFSYPLKKPMAVASFTGAMDGMLWSSLMYGTYMLWTKSSDENGKIFSTSLFLGLTSGNLIGLYSGYLGSSEGSHILKTYSAFYSIYAYLQVKRLLLGNYVKEENIKWDFLIATALSITGGLGTYTLTKDNYKITGGDALFIGANVIKGAVIFETPVQLAWINLVKETIFPVGGLSYYNDPLYDRISAFTYLSGMALGTYISYKIAKKKDFNILEGLVYSTVPIFAYYAGLAPLIVEEEYYRIMPLVQVTFDVGVSYLLYRLFVED